MKNYEIEDLISFLGTLCVEDYKQVLLKQKYSDLIKIRQKLFEKY